MSLVPGLDTAAREQVRRLAALVRDDADDVRHCAGLVAAVGDLDWRGAAAQAYREALAARVMSVRGASQELAELAAALQALADGSLP